MTIVVAAASPDSIALATDSRTTQRRGTHHRVTSDSAHKVFELSGSIGIATYGLAVIGRSTVAGLFDEWTATKPGVARLEEVAGSLGAFFQKRLEAATPARRGDLTDHVSEPWPLGFLVAGFETKGPGRVIEVKVRADRSEIGDTQLSTETPSVLFRGQTSPLRRLISGVDLDEMRRVNIQLDEDLQARMSTLQYDLVDPLTAQDAVDFACFLVDTTIQMQRFSDGTIAHRQRFGTGPIPGCGGPVQCLVVRPRGVDWVLRNDLTCPLPTTRATAALDVR